MGSSCCDLRRCDTAVSHGKAKFSEIGESSDLDPGVPPAITATTPRTSDRSASIPLVDADANGRTNVLDPGQRSNTSAAPATRAGWFEQLKAATIEHPAVQKFVSRRDRRAPPAGEGSRPSGAYAKAGCMHTTGSCSIHFTTPLPFSVSSGVSVPANLAIGCFTLGAVLVLIAVLGGRFKIFGAEVTEKTGTLPRVLSGIGSFALIAASLAMQEEQPTKPVVASQSDPSLQMPKPNHTADDGPDEQPVLPSQEPRACFAPKALAVADTYEHGARSEPGDCADISANHRACFRRAERRGLPSKRDFELYGDLHGSGVLCSVLLRAERPHSPLLYPEFAQLEMRLQLGDPTAMLEYQQFTAGSGCAQ